MGNKLSKFAIEMPDDFQVGAYEAVVVRLKDRRDQNPVCWGEYADAWKSIAWRFRACAEHDESFRDLLRKFGVSPQSQQRFNQERELFEFFVSGQSAVESFCYGAYAIGALLDSAMEKLLRGSPRDVTPKRTAADFQSKFSGTTLANSLSQLVLDQSFSEWSEIRNVLAHRGHPGRTFNVGGPGPEAVWNIPKLELNEDLTRKRRKWLADTLADLLNGSRAFADTKF